MPSAPKFTEVDWEAFDDGRRVRPSTVLWVVGFVALAALFAYRQWMAPSGTDLVLDWNPTYIDWLMLFSGWLFCALVVAPAVRNPRIPRQVWAHARKRPGVLLALCWLGLFTVVALVGPLLLERPHVHPALKIQPPVFLTVPEGDVIDCLGTVSNGACHGTWRYPLGTNVSGTDVVKLLVLGARVAFDVAFIAGMLMLPLAVAVGSLAGYYGGLLDTVLMGYVDVQETLPAFLVYLIVVFLFREGLIFIVVVFGLFSWGPVARVVRNTVRQRTEETFVRAAAAAGGSKLYVLRKHVLPNVSPVALAAVSRQVPFLVLAEVSLSFLDLNNPVLPSWGMTIATGTGSYWAPFSHRWWSATFAVIVLATTIVAFVVAGNALQDVLDPRR